MASIERTQVSGRADGPAVEDGNALDPANSERHFHRHPHTGIKREIWRPGDGDGDQRTEYYDRGRPLLLEQRWRLFQSDIGEVSWKNKNCPPRFVFLDDRAAYEVSVSDIPKTKVQQWWPHDFGSPCKLRKQRVHLGRPAIKDCAARGDAKFHSTQLAGKGGVYYFTGQKGYQPIVYQTPQKEAQPTEEEISLKRKAEEVLLAKDNPRAHGHNQYTPRDMMVKHGAPSLGKKPAKVHNLPALPRASSLMRPTQSPYSLEKRLYGGIGHHARESAAHQARRDGPSTIGSGGSSAAGPDRNAGAPHAPRRLSRLPGSAPSHGDAEAVERASDSGTAPPVGDIDVPRHMGYIERQDLVQTVTAKVIDTVQKQEDLRRLAHELTVEKIRVGQQSKELETLRQQLRASGAETDRLKRRHESTQAILSGLEAILGDKEQEIESLNAHVLDQKRQKVQLELQLARYEETIRSLRQGGR